MAPSDAQQNISTEDSTEILRIRDITCNYGPESAIQNVNINVTEGTQVCLLGPSGCGKTTVLRAIAGLQPISSGRIHIGDCEVSGPNISLPTYGFGWRGILKQSCAESISAEMFV